METIAGGTVKYVGIESVPCPDTPEALAECVRGGMLEIWSHGRVTERFTLRAGDQLLVADGATVGERTMLTQRAPWERALRAELPLGVEARAGWSEQPIEPRADDLDTRPRFAAGSEPIRLVLRDREGRVLVAHELDRTAVPAIAEGATVRRGDRLASIPTPLADRIAGVDALVAFLEARPTWGMTAVVAPRDGTIEAVDRRTATLGTRDGRILQLRLPRGRHICVRTGDEVGAGDRLTDGERSHHALLHAWGEARLAEHMIGELEREAARRGLAVPRVYWALAVRAMLRWRRIIDPGDTAMRAGAVVSRDELEHAQRSARTRGGRLATAVTVLRGLRGDVRARRSAANR